MVQAGGRTVKTPISFIKGARVAASLPHDGLPACRRRNGPVIQYLEPGGNDRAAGPLVTVPWPAYAGWPGDRRGQGNDGSDFAGLRRQLRNKAAPTLEELAGQAASA